MMNGARLRILIFGLLVCLALAIFLACAPANEVRYAFDRDFPPFSFIENEQYTGFDLDLLKAILAKSGLSIRITPLAWQAAQDQLAQGKVDIVSAMDKTPAREKLYDFPANPYVDYRLSLFVRNGREIKSLKDLKRKRIATQKSTTYQEFLRGIEGINIHLYETELDAIEALKKGKADAYVGAYEVASYYLKKTGWGTIKAVGEPLKVTPMYFAVRKGNKKLVKLIDEGLIRIKADGSHGRIYQKWF